MVKIIADLGSCHMGKLSYAMDAIKMAKDIGVDVLKFQMFQGHSFTKTGNIQLDRQWWPDLVGLSEEYNLPITASAFDIAAIHTLSEYKAPFIKFSYSCKDNPEWFDKAVRYYNQDIIISCDVMTKPHLAKEIKDRTKLLYCIPEYPVPYMVHFDGLFYEHGFDGFSDHTLGYSQSVVAARSGAKIIEKHMKLPYSDVNCPDAKFALSPREICKMVRIING